jgi:hypothetical protein
MVNVFITIVGDFRHFGVKKIGVFLEIQCCDQCYALASSILSKHRLFFRQFLAKLFCKS